MNNASLATVAAALMFLSGAELCAGEKTSRPPNIVFIMADDLGINDLACYGRKEHHTPNLDRLAKQGARFTNAYAAQSVCSPTRAALMTGKTPARLHLTTFLPGRADWAGQVYAVDGSSYFNRSGPRLIDGVEILADIFHPRGSHEPNRNFKRLS